MKKLALLSALILSATALNAQTIKGRVIDQSSEPIGYANVILYNLPDTTYVAGVITNDEGRFELEEAPREAAILEISFVGFETQYASAAIAEQTITLSEGGLSIDEVVVKGTRPISKITATGVQTTVENTVLSEMGTGNDVLKRIPMVTGDDGEFEVFGRGAAKIYINRREVRDVSELDNLNSSDIASVEVISNPGARYDASVAAVINIKTTKVQGDGFSFNTRSSFYIGENQDYINQINTNYRKGGLDIFANVYHSDITSIQRGDIYQITDVGTIWEQNSYIDGVFKTSRLNGTIGANYEINANHFVGIRYDHKTTPTEIEDFDLISEVFTDGVLYDNWNNSGHKEYTNIPTSQLNLYYAGTIGKLAIDFNTDYMSSEQASDNLNTEISEVDGTSYISSNNDVANKLVASKLQFSYPVWQGQLSAGSEYVDIERSDVYVSDLEEYNSSTDIFEQNLAFFAEYQAVTKIGMFSLGVRYEDATYEYLDDGVKDDEMSKSYGQWFPSASYANQFGEVGVQLSYTSQVVRPTYTQLSSNLTYANSLTLQTGNPYLSPTISQNVSLAGVWRNVQAQVSYTHQKDAIVYWIDQYEEDSPISIINYHNIDELPKMSVVVAYAPTIGVWSPQLSTGGVKYWQDLSDYGVDVEMNKPLFFANLNNTIELSNDFVINVDAAYISTGYGEAAYLPEPLLVFDAGVTKSFFAKALSVKLAVTDIANQKSSAAVLYMPQTTIENYYTKDSRELQLTIRYNFNSARSKYKGKGAGSEAKQRF
ncbi:MAG: outer membrane beta-barrel family protein [Rikenellaceae bacterium]